MCWLYSTRQRQALRRQAWLPLALGAQGARSDRLAPAERKVLLD